MELDFTVVAVDVDNRSSAKDIGCYVHMDGELLDVITPIRDKIGQENTLSVRVGERPGTLKLIVKRMGDLEELLGSASVPISVFAAMPTQDFSRLWVKLSSDSDSDLFIPTTPEETERPRLLVAYRTRGKSTPKASSPAPPSSPHNLQQRIWDLEAELEVTKTELRYEQERARHHSQDKERVKVLEQQLQEALEMGEEEKDGELLKQFKDFVEKQRGIELANEGRIRELVEEMSGLKGELASKQHHITTLTSEIAYLTQCLALEKASKPLVTEISTISLGEANEEISLLQQRLSELQAENQRLRRETEPHKDPESLPSRKDPDSLPSRKDPPSGDPRTPKSDKVLKRPQADSLEGILNGLLPKYGFTGKVTRVVEGIYLLGNKRIHAKMQGSTLITQLGGTADWLDAEELLSKLKEEGDAKSARRSCSVGQEGELPKEDQKPKPPSKLLRDFSPILKKKK